jgi:hypothetical protein
MQLELAQGKLCKCCSSLSCFETLGPGAALHCMRLVVCTRTHGQDVHVSFIVVGQTHWGHFCLCSSLGEQRGGAVK